MILAVIDKEFHKLLSFPAYSYATYTEKYNALGPYQVQVPLDSYALQTIQEGYYILLDKDVCGVIQSVKPIIDDTTEEKKLVIEGYLAEELLTRRCIPKSTSFTGTVPAFVNKLMTENCVSPQDSSRSLPIVLDSNVPTDSGSQERQVTGGDMECRIAELLDTRGMGHKVTPILTSTSISGFKFTQVKGADRSIKNTDGNKPVVFATSLKNILSGTYKRNSQDLKNTAYVAGEGEGTARTVKTVHPENIGVDRYELYVDARDLQSTDENGNTLTATQYEAALNDRGLAKLSEYVVSETYEATINTADDKFVYKKDYFVGDIITLKDELIGIELDVRITAVQTTSTDGETKIDLTLGQAKMRTNEKLKRKGVI